MPSLLKWLIRLLRGTRLMLPQSILDLLAAAQAAKDADDAKAVELSDKQAATADAVVAEAQTASEKVSTATAKDDAADAAIGALKQHFGRP